MPVLLLGTTSLFANTQQNTRRAIRATWVENPPVIDGDLTDTVWQHADIATDFFRSIFDYEFTPESHLFFVVVDSLPGDRAVFAKLAYLFEPSLPGFAQ